MGEKLYIYRADFNLEYPVNDIYDARSYLEEDDMTKYLINQLKCDFGDDFDTDFVVNVKWHLKTVQKGYIELTTTKELDYKVSEKISEWISGQNSDGLGEGFEQQGFANYNMNDYYENDYYSDEDGDYYDEDNYCMASFDWRTNDYKLKLISE